MRQIWTSSKIVWTMIKSSNNSNGRLEKENIKMRSIEGSHQRNLWLTVSKGLVDLEFNSTVRIDEEDCLIHDIILPMNLI